MDKQASSPVTVLGFATSSQNSSQSCLLARQPSGDCVKTSLLTSMLLSTKDLEHQPDAQGEDDYDDCEDSTSMFGDELDQPLSGVATGDARAQATIPIAIPSTLWLRDPNAIHEVRRMHYERCQRRMQLEQQALQMKQQAMAQQQYAQQQQVAQVQGQHY